MKKNNSGATMEGAPVKSPPRASTTARSEHKPLPAKKGTHHLHANGGPSKSQRSVRPGNGVQETKMGDLDSREILRALMTLKKGDFSIRLPIDWTGTSGKIADTFNDVAETMEQSSEDLSRISRLVGKEGRINERLATGTMTGAWLERIDSVNTLISCLVHPISETARVIGAVAKGDLSQTMATEIEGRKLEGEFAGTARTVNTMVDQLSSFSSEVTRVAREVGTEGKLGGQAKVKGVAGTWKDLTDNVNLMASNLTSQVRNIAT